MTTLGTAVLSVLSSATVLGVLLWVFKESLTQALRRSMEKDVAEHRSQLERKNQEELAEIKRTNQEQLERVKSELDQRNDAVRHSLQVALLKIQTSHGKKHEVFPEVFEKILVAEGAVGRLMGLRFSPTFEGYGKDDFRKVMEHNHLPSSLCDRLEAEIQGDRDKGVRRLREYLRRSELEEAHRKFDEAQNLVLLKALYLPAEIVSSAQAALKCLWEAWVDADVDGVDPVERNRSFRSNTEAAHVAIEKTREMMRSELSGTIMESTLTNKSIDAA